MLPFNKDEIKEQNKGIYYALVIIIILFCFTVKGQELIASIFK